MRPKRFLLLTAALSTAAAASACGKQREMPGNPKGTFYDAGAERFAANPKGSAYDSGLAEPPPSPPKDASGR